MPISQAMFMAGSGDSAFLSAPVPFSTGATSSVSLSAIFNATGLGTNDKVTFSSEIGDTLVTWYTGSYSIDSYDARFVITSASGLNSLVGYDVDTWHQLGTVATSEPYWTLEAGPAPSVCIGDLSIRNRVTFQVLVTVTLNMNTNSLG